MKDSTEIIFLGDSITDAGHNFQCVPKGERALGNGYVSGIADILKGRKGNWNIRNAGHDGFTVQGLLRMLEYDCLRYHPDIVSILVGCNDVAVCMNTGRTLKEIRFAENYRRLLRRIREKTEASVICMGPFIFPYPFEYRNWIPLIKEAEGIQKEAAADEKLPFIPLHDLLNQIAEKEGITAVTVDGIHLTDKGARIISKEWIKVGARYC